MLRIKTLNIAKNISFSSKRINNVNKNQNANLKDVNLNNGPASLNAKNSIDSKKIETQSFVNNFLHEDDEIKSAQMLIKRYPELLWLTGNVNATPEGNSPIKSNSISEKLFGQKHIEFDRTMVGINCLKYVLNNDYDNFTKCQKDSVKLKPEEFSQLRQFTTEVLKTPQDIDAMIAYTVINDLGKIKTFVEEIEEKTQTKTNDHDEALLIGLKIMPEQIPSFDRLSPIYKKDILNALNTNFNLAQFVQCECLEGNLQQLKDMDENSKNLYLVHVFYDVAGAAGHINPNGSLVMTSPVYLGYMQGINAINNKENKNEFDIFNDFLTQKANTLSVSLETPEDRALLKLAVMSRATTQKDIEAIFDAFGYLNYEEQCNLIKGLNSNGITNKGVLLYYSPAFIQNSINANPNNKIEMLAKAFKVMSKIYKQHLNDTQVGVETVSLLKIANKIKAEPNISAEELFEYFNTNN